MKRFAILGIALLMLLGTAASVSAAGKETATADFHGLATTGVGLPMPIDFNPADITVRSDGAIGIGYLFKANGTTKGQVPGDFAYEEHGYLFFTNPADPTTFAGSKFAGAKFTLQAKGTREAVIIADTNPEAYSNGYGMTDGNTPKGVLKQVTEALGQKGMSPKNGPLVYGNFTFTNQYGTFTGYSTPDSREFVITVKFDK